MLPPHGVSHTAPCLRFILYRFLRETRSHQRQSNLHCHQKLPKTNADVKYATKNLEHDQSCSVIADPIQTLKNVINDCLQALPHLRYHRTLRNVDCRWRLPNLDCFSNASSNIFQQILAKVVFKKTVFKTALNKNQNVFETIVKIKSSPLRKVFQCTVVFRKILLGNLLILIFKSTTNVKHFLKKELCIPTPFLLFREQPMSFVAPRVSKRLQASKRLKASQSVQAFETNKAYQSVKASQSVTASQSAKAN